MLDAARRGEFGTILAYSNSRLTRRVREYLDLIDLHNTYGVEIRTVVSGDHNLATADGRGAALTVAVWDQAEAERTSERRMLGNAAKLAEGVPLGRPRVFGYEVDGMTPREDEASLIRAAYRSLIDGVTVHEIARQWNAAGLRTLRGKEWSTVTTRNTLTRERNAGILIANGERVAESQITPIVDLDTFERANAILSAKGRRRAGRQTVDRWLSHVASCHCGEPLVVGASWSHGAYSPAYVCQLVAHASRTPGLATPPGHGRVKAEIAEAQVATVALLAVLDRHDRGVLGESDSRATAEAEGRLNALEARLSRVTAAYLDGVGDLSVLRSESAAIKAAIKSVRAEIATLTAADVMADVITAVGAEVDARGWTLPDVLHALDGWARWWHAQSIEARRRLVSALWADVRLQQPTGLPGRFTFDGTYEVLDQIDWRRLIPTKENR